MPAHEVPRPARPHADGRDDREEDARGYGPCGAHRLREAVAGPAGRRADNVRDGAGRVLLHHLLHLCLRVGNHALGRKPGDGRDSVRRRVSRLGHRLQGAHQARRQTPPHREWAVHGGVSVDLGRSRRRRRRGALLHRRLHDHDVHSPPPLRARKPPLRGGRRRGRQHVRQEASRRRRGSGKDAAAKGQGTADAARLDAARNDARFPYVSAV
mmetsp:Transcript_8497/g.25541  ORF Transcript_8497/g.25541 Transcript_8497/m.25541 type:complete len:212 (+) Transcript_8497:422-1057(+)